jgi:hypothetical protein
MKRLLERGAFLQDHHDAVSSLAAYGLRSGSIKNKECLIIKVGAFM